MRAADPGFDERRHGNLVEILRSVQRDGLVRLDRDRQGVLRVFQGPQLRLPAAPAHEPADEAAERRRARRLRDGSGRRAGGCRRLRCARCRPGGRRDGRGRSPTRPPPMQTPPSQASPRRTFPPPTGRRAAAARPGRQLPAPSPPPRPASRGRARRRRAERRPRSPNDPLASSPRRIHDVRHAGRGALWRHRRGRCPAQAPAPQAAAPAAPVVSPYIAPPDVAAPPGGCRQDDVRPLPPRSSRRARGSSTRRPTTSSP